jgi:CxxC motif-containing protein
MTIIDACVSGFLPCNFNSNKNIFKVKIEICPRDVRTNYPQKIITNPTRIPSPNTESSPEVTALLSKADKFIQEKKLKKGLELLHQAARINPKDPEILVRIGTVKVWALQPVYKKQAAGQVFFLSSKSKQVSLYRLFSIPQ